MKDNFQQTVNLRQKIKKEEPSQKRAEGIDKIYEGEKFSNKIEKPKVFNMSKTLIKKILTAVILVLAVLMVYFIFWSGGRKTEEKISWYAVELTGGEIYYGQIEDKTADPVIVKNVYYDYDQDKEKKEGEPGSLRLVKRGKETQGGDGSMNIVRAQVLYMEPLREDSKVLQAILEYEK